VAFGFTSICDMKHTLFSIYLYRKSVTLAVCLLVKDSYAPHYFVVGFFILRHVIIESNQLCFIYVILFPSLWNVILFWIICWEKLFFFFSVDLLSSQWMKFLCLVISDFFFTEITRWHSSLKIGQKFLTGNANFIYKILELWKMVWL